MTENTRDEWTCGYNCTRINEGMINAFGPLMCEKDVSYFHMEVQEKSHHELNGLPKNCNYFIKKWRATLKEKTRSKSGWQIFLMFEVFW